MDVEDLEIPFAKITEAAQRVLDRGLEEARRRKHGWLQSEHLFCALAQVEWDLFAQAMGDAKVNPQDMVRAVDDYLRADAPREEREPRIAPAARLVCKMALHHATRSGRGGIEPADLLRAIIEDPQGMVASILRGHDVDPDVLVSRLDGRVHDLELRVRDSEVVVEACSQVLVAA